MPYYQRPGTMVIWWAVAIGAFLGLCLGLWALGPELHIAVADSAVITVVGAAVVYESLWYWKKHNASHQTKDGESLD